jgi:hypothetical protein
MCQRKIVVTKKYSAKLRRSLRLGAEYTIKYFVEECYREFGKKIKPKDVLESFAVILAHYIIDCAPNSKEAKEFWVEAFAVAFEDNKKIPERTLH